MKRAIKISLVAIMPLFLLSNCKNTAIVAQTAPAGPITYQDFYDDLSPYGTWIDYPTYGHVWHPRIDGDFRPYATNGNWEYSTDGWAWNSNYNWGWAPFHYGSWLYDDMYGWLWVPGYQWSPAWVTWGNVDDYYCWAPITPGVSIGVAFGSYRPNSFYWNICDRGHIYDRNLGGYILGRPRINDLAGHITIINNFHNGGHGFYSRGPNVQDVERYTHRTINPVRFRDVNHPGQLGHGGPGDHDNQPGRGNLPGHNDGQAGHGIPPAHNNEMNVFRPDVRTPQPNEFKRPEPGQTRPISEEHQVPSIGRTEQHNNIESMPTHRGEGGFPSGGFRGGGERGGGGFRGGSGGGGRGGGGGRH